VSAFLDLIADAEKLGVTKLTWSCDVAGWSAEPQRPGRWKCRASASDPEPVVFEGLGRTGEEALREVVDFLRALQ
jgi:hypothetical protein